MSLSEVERLECGAQYYDECHVHAERDAARACIAALEAERDALNAGVERMLARIATLEAALRDLEIAATEVIRCADVLVPGLEAWAGGMAAERVAQVARPLRRDAPDGGPTDVILRARAALGRQP